MENPVVIKIIKNGQKNYITKVQPSSFSYQPSKSPFNDPEILKFEPEEALKIAEKLSSSFYGLSVVDTTGKNIYHRYDKIIKEEIQKFINEGYVMTDDRFDFKQRLTNSYFYGYQNFTTDFDEDIVGSDIVVTWKVSFWLNQFGIENLIIDVEKIEGYFLLELYDKQTDELKQETQKNIQDFQWKFDLDSDEVCLKKGGTLYITELEFNFKDGVCRIKFN